MTNEEALKIKDRAASLKYFALPTFIGLILYGSVTFSAEENPFKLSQGKIQEAIQYGMTADFDINDFGGYDIGLNKFSLGEKTGYFDLLTPYCRIASLSLKKKKSGKQLSYEEAEDRNKRPVELRVFLYVKKNGLNEPITCLIKTSKGSLDISGMVMEFSMCNDETGDCTRCLAYLFPTTELQRAETFQVIISGEKLGEKIVDIKMTQIK